MGPPRRRRLLLLGALRERPKPEQSRVNVFLSLFTLVVLCLGHGDWIRDLAKSVGLGLEREWWKDGWAGRGGGTDHLFCFGLRCTYPEKVCMHAKSFTISCSIRSCQKK